MRREGVTLTEVLVAAVLLAVGIAGTLSAVATALRLRTAATAHEALSVRASDRLAWFAREACTLPETTLAWGPDERGIEERFRVERSEALVRLDGRVRSVRGASSGRLGLDVRVACE